MSEQVVNIGQVAAIWIASTPPENIKLIWYNTASQVHCVYDSYTGDWKPLNPQIITTTSINTLRSEAVQSGLPIGKFYNLEDTGTLAISITTTKIWYVDTHGNYVVDDLSSSAQYYLNSTNLYIDGETGVWDVDSGHLNFSFTEQNAASNIDTDKDYVVMRHNAGNGVWSWIKSKISTFISSVGGNSVSWNNGIYFNFSSAINAIKNVAGGVVGYSEYESDKAALQQSIQNTALNNQSYAAAANSYTDSKVTDEKIYDKELPTALTVPSAPPTTPSVGAKLITILGQIYGWISKLKVGSNIFLTQGLNPNGINGNVNSTDSISNAFSKVIGWIKKLQLANNINIGTGFNPEGVQGDFSVNDSVQDSVEKLIWRTKHVIKIDEENWHTEDQFYWIIRHDILFIRFRYSNPYQFNFIDTDSFSTHDLIKINGLSFSDASGGFSQYIDLIFNKIPWLENHNASGVYTRRKYIYIYTPHLLYANIRTKGGGTISFNGNPMCNYFGMYLYYEEIANSYEGGTISSRSFGLGVRCTSGDSEPMLCETSSNLSLTTPEFSKVLVSYLSTSTIFTFESLYNEIIPTPLPV